MHLLLVGKVRKHAKNYLRTTKFASFAARSPPVWATNVTSIPPHYIYVLGAGRARVTDDKGTREIQGTPGIFRANPRIEWHEILNIGDTTLQYLVVEPK